MFSLSAKVSKNQHSTTLTLCIVFVLEFRFFLKPAFSSLISLCEDAENDYGENNSDKQRQTEADREENPCLSLDHAAR